MQGTEVVAAEVAVEVVVAEAVVPWGIFVFEEATVVVAEPGERLDVELALDGVSDPGPGNVLGCLPADP